MVSAYTQGAGRCHIILLLCLLLALAVGTATATTTELHVKKLAADGVTVIGEKTVDYRWLEQNLPIQGDGVTHYYHQGPVFEGDPWNPEEDVNVLEKDMGAVKGTDLRDICELVGGMGEEDTVKIRASDGMSKTFPYRNVYEPESRQGPMVITWYRAEDGYVPDYYTGMRLVFFADTSTNPDGIHAFGVWDMHECFDEEDWYFFQPNLPTTTGLSVQYVSEITIYSDEEPTGSIHIISTPAGATVFIDDEETGSVTPCTLSGIEVGSHSVRVELEGFAPLDEKWITVSAGSITMIYIGFRPGGFGPGVAPLNLWPGWNFVSTPKQLAAGANTFAIFNDIDTAGHSILLYDSLTGWDTMEPEDEFRPLDGIWIYANGTYKIPLVFAATSNSPLPTKVLDRGWNAIGFTNVASETAASTLLPLGEHWTTLIGYDAKVQRYEDSIIRGGTGRHSEMREMFPFRGYWIYMNDVDTLVAIGA